MSGAVLCGQAVHVSAKSTKITVGRQPPAKPAAEPHVELIRDGDVITGIEVTCGCGQVLKLRCVY